jgi:hypothetical protein
MPTPKPEDLIPLSDDEVAFSVRMASKGSYKGRRGKAPIEESEAAETFAAQRLVEGLKSRGLLFYRRRTPDPPPSGQHAGSGPGSFVKTKTS